MTTNYATQIFNTVIGALPSGSSPQKTRIMGLVDLGTAISLPVGDSTTVGDFDELALVVPTTSDTYKSGVVYFNNVLKNTEQTNSLTIINIGQPASTLGQPSTLTGLTLGSVDDFKLINNGSFAFDLFTSQKTTAYKITNLDFTTATIIDDITTIINNNVVFSSVATCSIVGNKIVMTTLDATTGLTFTPLRVAEAGTDISNVTYLNAENPVIVNGVASTLSYLNCINKLLSYLQTNSNTAPYVVAVPSVLIQDNTFLTFLNAIAISNPLTRILSDYNTLLPSTDFTLQKYFNIPNIFIAYTLDYNEYCYCAILGRLSRYIISTLYLMNSTNLSPISNITPANLNYSQQTSFKTNNFNYVQLQSSTRPIPSLQLGVFMDGAQYTDRYGVETTKWYVDEQVNNFIYDLNNTIGSPLPYNQIGLETILAQIISSLTKCLNCGLIDSYQNLTFIPFLTYIAQNPDDYSKGIYNGFSTDIRIKEFYTKITLFANLGV